MLDAQENARECFRLTKEAIERGLDDSEALSLASLVRVAVGHEVAASAELAERALMLNPNSARAWYAVGLARISVGSFDEAAKFIDQSIRLNPKDPVGYAYQTSYALAQLLSKQFELAIKAAEKALALHSSFLPALRIKAASLAMLGRLDEAGEVVSKVKTFYPGVNIAAVSKTMIPIRREDLEYYGHALEKAGMTSLGIKA